MTVGSEPSGEDTEIGPDTAKLLERLRSRRQPLAEPTQIGRFVVLRKIGEGGMGVVYAGYDNQLDRKVAIKLVRSAQAVDAEARARVRREAQALAKLSHPNVVQVYEVGEHEGQVYVAMEFVTGPTLAQWADAHAPGPERWRAMLAKYIEAGRGLAAAHAAGIVHRDFKPANAILGEDGRVRVLDFGIARTPTSAPDADAGAGTSMTMAAASHSLASGPSGPASGPESSVETLAVLEPEPEPAPEAPPSPAMAPAELQRSLTLTGAMVGTPAYMSPEQFEQRPVDARSDQFSFCVALFEALYGQRPFLGTTPVALMLAVVGHELTLPPADAEVPIWVRDVVMRGLAHAPADRWPSMLELLDALGRDPAELRRRRRRTLVAVGLSVSAILASIWFARGQMRSANAAEAARREAVALEAQTRERKLRAEAERDRALRDAQEAAARARDTARVLAARGLADDPSSAAALLRDVERPELTPSWRSTAVNVLQQPICEQVLRGHTGRIVDLDFSPDDRWLVSASMDGSARVWALDVPGSAATVLAHDDRVLRAGFSPDGRQIVTAGADGIVRLWPAPTAPGQAAGEPLLLRGHVGLIWSASFSQDGRRLVTAGLDGSARVWTLADLERPRVIRVDGATIRAAELAPDGDHVLLAASDGRASVWSLTDPARLPLLLEGHQGPVVAASFDPRGRLVATASDDGTGRVFALDLAGWTATEVAVLEHDAEVSRVLFGPDGRELVTVSRDRSAKLWRVDADGRLVAAPRVFDGYAGRAWGGAWGAVGSAALSSDDRLLAIGARDRAVEVWPLAGGPPLILRGHDAEVAEVEFDHAGARLVTGSNDATLRVWTARWDQVGRSLIGDGPELSELVASDSLIAAGGEDGQVSVWDLGAADHGAAATAAPMTLTGHRGELRLALAPSRLVSVDEAGRVRVWTLRDGTLPDPERPLTFAGPPRPASVTLDPAGELLVVQSRDGEVFAWQLPSMRSPKLIGPRALARHPVALRSTGVVAFDPTGRLLVSAGNDGRVLVWTRAELLGEPDEGRALAPELAPLGRVTGLAWSPEGRRLAVAGAERRIRVLDLDEAGVPGSTRDLEVAGVVTTLAFAPARHGGERWLAAGGADTRVLVWDLDQPELDPRALTGPAGDVRDLAFGPGEPALLAAASLDGTVHLWALDDDVPPLVFDAGGPLRRLAFVDGGRRLAASGSGSRLPVWYLGEALAVADLRARLAAVTSLCLTATQRMQLVGESQADAEAEAAACARSE